MWILRQMFVQNSFQWWQHWCWSRRKKRWCRYYRYWFRHCESACGTSRWKSWVLWFRLSQEAPIIPGYDTSKFFSNFWALWKTDTLGCQINEPSSDYFCLVVLVLLPPFVLKTTLFREQSINFGKKVILFISEWCISLGSCPVTNKFYIAFPLNSSSSMRILIHVANCEKKD